MASGQSSNNWQENIKIIADNTASGGGGGGGGGAVTVADGADVAQGSTTDAAGSSTLVGQAKQLVASTGVPGDSAYTSGAGSLVSLLKGIFGRLALGQQLKAASLPVVLASDQGSLLTKGDSVEQSSLSAGALNADLVAATDVSNYKWFSLQIVGGTWSGTLSFQGSNDNSNWQSVQVATVGGNTSLLTSTSSNNFYHGSLDFRYFRVRMTAYTSGTALGTLELYTNPPASPQWTLPVSQSGNWTVLPGNTQNTTPWLVGALVTAPLYASLSAQSGYVAAWGSNPAALTANTDASFKWGGSGTTVVNHIMIQNNTALNVLWDLDVATSLGSPVLQPNQSIFLDVQTTALHLQANGTPNLNGTSGSNIVVRAWL
ncbi:MAG TPA: hypothetical protein VHL10_00800 [Nitrososphaera sp.]|jgi:hypothetical protein|nr:hypothetical protein [Nitrososphaera sp.]